jgi:hypothetical protein
MLATRHWGWLVSGFTEHLQTATTHNYNTLANSPTLLLTIAHTQSSQLAMSLPVVAQLEFSNTADSSAFVLM